VAPRALAVTLVSTLYNYPSYSNLDNLKLASSGILYHTSLPSVSTLQFLTLTLL